MPFREPGRSIKRREFRSERVSRSITSKGTHEPLLPRRLHAVVVCRSYCACRDGRGPCRRCCETDGRGSDGSSAAGTEKGPERQSLTNRARYLTSRFPKIPYFQHFGSRERNRTADTGIFKTQS